MFNINDYITFDTAASGGKDVNPTLIMNMTIDRDKIKHDADVLKGILQDLQNLIGPYTLKVNDSGVKMKNKKKHK